jgi:hypothetical protein
MGDTLGVPVGVGGRGREWTEFLFVGVAKPPAGELATTPPPPNEKANGIDVYGVIPGIFISRS